MINNIQNAMNVKLAAVGSLPTVYYPNVESTPTQGTNYVRPTLLPAAGTLNTLAGLEQHEGIYQVDIFTQLKKGTAPLFLIADSIRESFKGAKSLTSGGQVVHIQAVSISQARKIESWWSCYVQVNYLVYN